MWIKDKVNDCYKMSHSHLITIEKENRNYTLYFRDKRIKTFPTLAKAKQYGDFFQLDTHTRYAIYLIHNFRNCTCSVSIQALSIKTVRKYLRAI